MVFTIEALFLVLAIVVVLPMASPGASRAPNRRAPDRRDDHKLKDGEGIMTTVLTRYFDSVE